MVTAVKRRFDQADNSKKQGALGACRASMTRGLNGTEHKGGGDG